MDIDKIMKMFDEIRTATFWGGEQIWEEYAEGKGENYSWEIRIRSFYKKDSDLYIAECSFDALLYGERLQTHIKNNKAISKSNLRAFAKDELMRQIEKHIGAILKREYDKIVTPPPT